MYPLLLLLSVWLQGANLLSILCVMGNGQDFAVGHAVSECGSGFLFVTGLLYWKHLLLAKDHKYFTDDSFSYFKIIKQRIRIFCSTALITQLQHVFLSFLFFFLVQMAWNCYNHTDEQMLYVVLNWVKRMITDTCAPHIKVSAGGGIGTDANWKCYTSTPAVLWEWWCSTSRVTLRGIKPGSSLWTHCVHSRWIFPCGDFRAVTLTLFFAEQQHARCYIPLIKSTTGLFVLTRKGYFALVELFPPISSQIQISSSRGIYSQHSYSLLCSVSPFSCLFFL